MDISTLTIADAKAAIERGKNIEAALHGAATETAIRYTETGPQPPDERHGLQIVILDRGFVYVGDVTITDDWVVIENAKNVRRWGTKEGLGELAAKGPQPETKLDMGGTVRAPRRALIGLLKCEAASWKK